jgi:hypothetical protein
MIVVIFEVWPAEGRKDDYLALAAALRDDLGRIDARPKLTPGPAPQS